MLVRYLWNLRGETMLKMQFNHNWLSVVNASQAAPEILLSEGVLRGEHQELTAVRSSLRIYGRMRQLIILIIVCIVVYVIWRLVHDIVLAKADNLLLKLPKALMTFV